MDTVALTGPELPVEVCGLPDPPDRLFLTGVMPAGPRVAIVGTRRPTDAAQRFAEQLAFELSAAGIVVVSGGALGIDAAAHRGAMRAQKGTLVVAPSSYCCPYPLENRGLFQQVVQQGGGYLTPFEQPTQARRHAFFARNGLLVSLCLTVVMVQAPFRSGARNAVLWARRLRKPYWVVPHPPWCPQGGACVEELRLGGSALASSRDILTWLSSQNQHPIPQSVRGRDQATRAEAAPNGPPKDSGARANDPAQVTRRVVGQACGPERDVCRLVGVLRERPRHPDELCELLNWEPARVHVTVLQATLLGEAQRLASGNIALAATSTQR